MPSSYWSSAALPIAPDHSPTVWPPPIRTGRRRAPCWQLFGRRRRTEAAPWDQPPRAIRLQNTVSLCDTNAVIDGVQNVNLVAHVDDRGYLIEIVRTSDSYLERFGQ